MGRHVDGKQTQIDRSSIDMVVTMDASMTDGCASVRGGDGWYFPRKMVVASREVVTYGMEFVFSGARLRSKQWKALCSLTLPQQSEQSSQLGRHKHSQRVL